MRMSPYRFRRVIVRSWFGGAVQPDLVFSRVEPMPVAYRKQLAAIFSVGSGAATVLTHSFANPGKGP
jgi:hypothetical protein